MFREKFTAARDWIEDSLRGSLGKISPERRVLLIITLFLIFAALSLYITFSSIYRFGRGEGVHMQMRHIESLKIELRQKQHEVDSLKQLNDSDYGNER